MWLFRGACPTSTIRRMGRTVPQREWFTIRPEVNCERSAFKAHWVSLRRRHDARRARNPTSEKRSSAATTVRHPEAGLASAIRASKNAHQETLDILHIKIYI